jgi:hypothetical protein
MGRPGVPRQVDLSGLEPVALEAADVHDLQAPAGDVVATTGRVRRVDEHLGVHGRRDRDVVLEAGEAPRVLVHAGRGAVIGDPPRRDVTLDGQPDDPLADVLSGAAAERARYRVPLGPDPKRLQVGAGVRREVRDERPVTGAGGQGRAGHAGQLGEGVVGIGVVRAGRAGWSQRQEQDGRSGGAARSHRRDLQGSGVLGCIELLREYRTLLPVRSGP